MFYYQYHFNHLRMGYMYIIMFSITQCVVSWWEASLLRSKHSSGEVTSIWRLYLTSVGHHDVRINALDKTFAYIQGCIRDNLVIIIRLQSSSFPIYSHHKFVWSGINDHSFKTKSYRHVFTILKQFIPNFLVILVLSTRN